MKHSFITLTSKKVVAFWLQTIGLLLNDLPLPTQGEAAEIIRFYVDISDSEDSPVISEVTKVSQKDDVEAKMGNNLLNSEEKVTSQRVRLTGANKRMFNLLKKAKVQLIKIDQQKQLKSVGVCTTYTRYLSSLLYVISCGFGQYW